LKNGWSAPLLSDEEKIKHENTVIVNDVAAISVGIVDGQIWTDLDYILDSNADVDMNVVMTSDGEFVEVQGTGEEATYSRAQLDDLLDSATSAIIQLHVLQKEILSSE
jgi:ribonuclease PH